MKFQVFNERETSAFFQKAKAQMIFWRLREEHVVQEADRDGRLEFQVVLTLMKLLLVELAGVIKNALFVMAESKHLHFHVELSTSLVARLDIKDGKLVVQCLPGIERVKQFNG